jgi:DNA polymerase (family 10)
MENTDFAKIFYDVAKLLELKQENVFKIRAYQRAATNVENLSHSLETLYKEGNASQKDGGLKALEEIPGIGKNIAGHIEEIIKTKTFKEYEQLKKSFPKGFVELSQLPGLGPKTALKLYKELKIDSVEKLKKAALSGELRKLSGFGSKKEENVLKGIELKKKHLGRFLLNNAEAHAEYLLEHLNKLPEVEMILPCGSLRRGQETVGDLDILVVSKKPQIIMDSFVKLPAVRRVLAHGETKSSVILENGMQADLRVVEANSFGAAAHYFTGSKQHNIHIRQLAQKKGWKVNEYGIFDKNDKQIGGATEEDMFEKFGLQYIPPELREMRGEFEAAAKGEIPKLVERKDIKGDLHMHTRSSDGQNTIEEMAEAAKKLGYEYIAITDHTISTRIAGGLSEKEALKHIKEIHEANEKIKGIRILSGAEVDIKNDGSLDYSDEILRQFDWLIASIHANFKMPKDLMTARIIKAMENPYVCALGHPTGRLIGQREAYEVDMEAVLQACKKHKKAIEINSFPDRLDLTDIWCKRAKELGVKIIINTDSHQADQLELIKYGILTARRGWLAKEDVLNTLPLEKFLKAINSGKPEVTS